MTMTDRLDEIQQRYEKSTPGTWEKRPGDVQDIDKGLPRPLVRHSDGQPIHAVAIAGEMPHSWHWITTACETNVDFIAHAHQDIPYLLTQLREAEMRYLGIQSAFAFEQQKNAEAQASIAQQDQQINMLKILLVEARAAHDGLSWSCQDVERDLDIAIGERDELQHQLDAARAARQGKESV